MTAHKTWVNKLSHHIKIYLSKHISTSNLKVLSFIIALLSCLASGSILLFSLYSVSIHELIGMSYLQINFIASLSAIGMYLCLPILGYLSDSYGPSLLSMMSIWLFVPSYFFAAKIILAYSTEPPSVVVAARGAENFYLYSLSACFFFVGLATSSLYFLSLLTCARIYPQYKGLAISLPVSCYGMSSLILSQFLKLDFFHYPRLYSGSDGGTLDLVKVFTFYVYLYLVVGVLNFVACSIVSIESEVVFSSPTELTPLIGEDSSSSRNSTSSASGTTVSSEGDPFLPPREVIEPPNHHERFILFLKDPSAWLILLSLILNIGPMESFQNNLGSIINNSNKSVDLANQVSIMATSSTVSRLLLGILSDYISSSSRKYPVCRVWILVFVILIGILGQTIPILTKISSTKFGFISILNGFSYGGSSPYTLPL